MPGTNLCMLCSPYISFEFELMLEHYFVTVCIGQSIHMDQVFTVSMLMEVWA